MLYRVLGGKKKIPILKILSYLGHSKLLYSLVKAKKLTKIILVLKKKLPLFLPLFFLYCLNIAFSL